MWGKLGVKGYKAAVTRLRPLLGAMAIVCLPGLVAGCSDVMFPAVHDMPAPRADTPLTPDQVKQLSDDLATQRDHLQSSAASAPTAAPAPQKTSLQSAATANPDSLTTQSTATSSKQ